MANSNGDSYIPIEPAQLEQCRQKANALLKSASWKPTLDKIKPAASEPTAGGFGWRSSAVLPTQEEKISLVANAYRVSRDELVLTDTANTVLNAVRKGLAIGMHLAALYKKFSGIESMEELNARGRLMQQQVAEFTAKSNTAAAIAAFVPAYYIVWELSRHKTEQASSVKLDFQGIPELTLLGPARTLECVMYYYGAYVEKSGSVNTDMEFLKMTLLYFQGVIDEIKMRKDSLQSAEFFTDKQYKLVGEDFAVRGFETSLGTEAASVSFNRIGFDEIVGNRDAKHKARRMVERLCCYNPKEKRNPMYDLGALTTFWMGMGKPGTGKSMLIAATATMLDDLCKRLGTPFLFWPFPDTPVSTFQGGSAERVTEWFKPLRDPSRIVYAPIDDAENSLEERTRQGVSSGVREVIGVVLRNTEGAYAVNYGHAVLNIMTNLPEQVDKAVLSRIQERMAIEGATRFEDFMDQDYLWYRKYAKFDQKFANLRVPKGYEFLSAQKELHSLSDVYREVKGSSDETVQRIYEQTRATHNPEEEHEFFARFFESIQKEFLWFSSRDLRNIAKAVDDRVMDFDLPQEWWDEPERFFLKDYDTKRGMIVEHIKANLKGLTFAQVRLQESLRYIDTAVKIGQTDWQRRLEARVQDYLLEAEARGRLAKKMKEQGL